ncbi:ATP-dependent endonuclease [Burkholderia sp. Bp9099]|uniref:ATP-dependent nuclease n=1 Tax=Burkholderia sp. Bp9099 TaxID=2184568 RepID=UPI000F5E5344|nr:AAA family ATPase [Burkholderia sp. Bp9099]RQZ48254.1 hypothetical protein DIE17_12670 [Burkholderia sp. Bp9099]
MLNVQLSFDLPAPWDKKKFELSKLGRLNFLVGPNGSGKSRFADSLRHHLPNCRTLGTERLQGFEKNAGMGFLGDNFGQGFQKSYFDHFKNAGKNFGAGLDALVLLEERLDLRLKVEATLSHLFGRTISLEWDSGNLIPKAMMENSSTSYRLDKDECHGIKELLILLTHLYNDSNEYLIIDEPELNLHPQYQTFFVEECRKVVSREISGTGLKSILLITHSPFMLDFRGVDDIKSVISFDRKFDIPKTLANCDDETTGRLSSLVSRINVHHKQLFFSDNPVFVEGVWDFQIVTAIQQARGVSVAGAGSCIIYAGGCEEVNKFLELCIALGKRAAFLYDLDSLFLGTLRACVKGDNEVISFLARIGLGGNFGSYCGQLDKKLGEAVNAVLAANDLPETLADLRTFLNGLRDGDTWETRKLQRARVALLTALGRDRINVLAVLGNALVSDIEGRLTQIGAALRSKNIQLLLSGALENYLPSYAGSIFSISDEQKKLAVEAELDALSKPMNDSDLQARYGGLFDAIRALPSKTRVDFDSAAKDHIADYIHEIQKLVMQHQTWTVSDFQERMRIWRSGVERLLRLTTLSRVKDIPNGFHAELELLLGDFGAPKRTVRFSHETNAGMKQFSIVKVGDSNDDMGPSDPRGDLVLSTRQAGSVGSECPISLKEQPAA